MKEPNKTMLRKLTENLRAKKSGSASESTAAVPWERDPRMQSVEEYYASGGAALSGAPYAQSSPKDA